MYNMRAFLAAVLIFAAFAVISGKPQKRNSPHGPPTIDDVPGPHGPPTIDDVPGPHGPPTIDDVPDPYGPPTIDDVPGPRGPPTIDDVPGPHGPPTIDDVPGPRGPPTIDDVPGPHGPPLIPNDVQGPHDKETIEDHSDNDDMVTIDDMILPRKGLNILKKDGIITKRQAYISDDGQDFKWPKANGVATVPYTVGRGIDTDVLQRAIAVFSAKTCIRFVERDAQKNYVKFQIHSKKCGAQVGNGESGEQICYLTSGCSGKKGKVLHEMMHILSFLHEQCRPDRDSYITVHTDRIKSGYSSNFQIYKSKDLGIPYDCDSILHYRSTAFAASRAQQTITSSHCSHLGNDDTRLSLLDYKRVNTLYGCGKPDYKYYTVRVVTYSSWWSGTGTDCFIYLTLHGSQQTSTEFELDLSTNPSANLFESGSTDTFKYMAYRNDLGSITGISVRMVAHGSGQAWRPNTFTITDPDTGTSATFKNKNKQWLYPSSTYGTSNFPAQ